MSDWQVGDLAVCVKRGLIVCEHGVHYTGENNPSVTSAMTVIGIQPAMIVLGRGAGHSCGCADLCFADGSHGLAVRFRKILPDKQEKCEPEFVTLLKRIKIGVSA